MEIKTPYFDEHLIIAEKPHGLLSVQGRGQQNQDCLIARAQIKFADALIVHRLDMATSGLMVLARGEIMQTRLAAMFETRAIEKTYIALVHGIIADDFGEISAPLIKDWPNRPKQMVDWDIGKRAKTHYKVLARGEKTTRVELSPITGRTHQLRVHLKWLGSAICGDTLYIGDDDGYSRLMLHAQKLVFNHPEDGKELSLTSAPDF